MRIALIDDEPLARSGARARLSRYPEVEVVAEYGDADTALRELPKLRDKRPDLILLDIDMPGMTGLDMIAAMNVADRPMVILLTAHEQFALQAFALDVVDYLLKPIDEDRLDDALRRARRLLPVRHAGVRSSLAEAQNKQTSPDTDSANGDQRVESAASAKTWTRSFTVRIGQRICFLSVDDIDWIGADGDYACLHADGREYLVRESLSHLAGTLNPSEFMRVHRSTIVRISRIGDVRMLANRDAMLAMLDGVPVRVSRTYVDDLLKALERRARK